MPNNDQSEYRRHLDESWYWYLTGKYKEGTSPEYEQLVKRIRRTSGLFPGAPRCLECNLPMTGLAGWLTRTRPASYSPRLCNKCEEAMRKEVAGTEVELSMLFADVRGSTSLAQATSTFEFQGLIQRFYQTVSDVLIRHNAMVNRLMGDQVIGLFVPRFAGSEHAGVAVATALEILRATGHEDEKGPWIPIGIGVHTGVAYVGAVGTASGVNEIAVLGSAPNLAARLSSQAAAGEVIISETTAAAAGLTAESVERRNLELKGTEAPVVVRVLRAEKKRDLAGWR